MKKPNFVNYKLFWNEEKKSNRSRLFGNQQQIEPWYSMNRDRNVFIVSGLVFCLIFMKPISDIVYSIRFNIRLIRKRKEIVEEVVKEMEVEDQSKKSSKI
ncbi:hypothetical protein SSS_09979 [Sarcoptes scabiei]|nr:hypothetical protein SSS_09979 [Sarcoptes scabiei]